MQIQAPIVFLVFFYTLESFLTFGLLHALKKSQFLLKMTENTQNNQIVFGGLHHCGLLVQDMKKAIDFYVQVIGLEDDSHLRPSTLPFPGAFLKYGPQQIHLMQLPNPDEASTRPDYVGRDRHVALSINNVDLLARRLEERGVPFKLSLSGRKALFTRDVDQNGLEFVEDSTIY
jgi:glyoxylase I family protein